MTSIYHLITTLNRGGAENQLLVLATEQVKLGFHVTVIYLKGEPELLDEFSKGGVYVQSGLASKSPLLQVLLLRRLFRNSDVLVHAHLPRAELLGSLAVNKSLFLTSRHNAEPFFPNAPKFVSNFLARFVQNRSLRIIAISNAVREFLICQGEVDEIQKIEVVHYGYQPKFNTGSRISIDSPELLRVGTISRLAPQKDLQTLINTFSSYRTRFPESSLSVVGDGPLRSELTQDLERRNLTDSVTFLGRTSSVFKYLSTLDVFILTSRYEGFGMVLLEAMDAGIPIIASNNSAIPEVLGENFLGLCETGNPQSFLEKMIAYNNPSIRNAALAQQELRLKLFSAEKMNSKISKIYSELRNQA
jgi:glycosyltransferase involved in cell wall biosynthesis